MRRFIGDAIYYVFGWGLALVIMASIGGAAVYFTLGG
mgnify:CR=1 FL=1